MQARLQLGIQPALRRQRHADLFTESLLYTVSSRPATVTLYPKENMRAPVGPVMMPGSARALNSDGKADPGMQLLW